MLYHLHEKTSKGDDGAGAEKNPDVAPVAASRLGKGLGKKPIRHEGSASSDEASPDHSTAKMTRKPKVSQAGSAMSAPLPHSSVRPGLKYVPDWPINYETVLKSLDICQHFLVGVVPHGEKKSWAGANQKQKSDFVALHLAGRPTQTARGEGSFEKRVFEVERSLNGEADRLSQTLAVVSGERDWLLEEGVLAAVDRVKDNEEFVDVVAKMVAAARELGWHEGVLVGSMSAVEACEHAYYNPTTQAYFDKANDDFDEAMFPIFEAITGFCERKDIPGLRELLRELRSLKSR
ncbi:hypothetical protein L1987_33294 [Smallanthus sonchifolius]|uniref:Uncharacterized protein n=1 Tax=Smallanthus sonchifolius TaxID=185202 RepID=A0ACB9HRG8_9ASTR|nr:hypothetical protein L1987_33294 [Smallanthus sonchifolius]